MAEPRTSNRAYWEFTISRSALTEAVTKKIAHHTERLEHWTERMAKAEEDLRERGIDFREATKPMPENYRSAGSINALSTQYYQQPTLHPEFIAALQEAQNKVQEHRAMLRGFHHWEAAIPHGPAEYALTYDDITYFGL